MKKRIISLIAAAVAALSLSACGSAPEGPVEAPGFLTGGSPAKPPSSSSSSSQKPAFSSAPPASSSSSQSAVTPPAENAGFTVEAGGSSANFIIDNVHLTPNTNEAVLVYFTCRGQEYSVGAHMFSSAAPQCSAWKASEEKNTYDLIGYCGYFFDGDRLTLSVDFYDYGSEYGDAVDFNEVSEYRLSSASASGTYPAEQVVKWYAVDPYSDAKTGRYYCENAPFNWLHNLIVSEGGNNSLWYRFGMGDAYAVWEGEFDPNGQISLTFSPTGASYPIAIKNNGNTIYADVEFGSDKYRLTYVRNTTTSTFYDSPDTPPDPSDSETSSVDLFDGDYTLAENPGDAYIRLWSEDSDHDGVREYCMEFEDRRRVSSAEWTKRALASYEPNGKRGKFFEWAKAVYPDSCLKETITFSSEGLPSAYSMCGMEIEIYPSGDDLLGIYIIDPKSGKSVKGEFVKIS